MNAADHIAQCLRAIAGSKFTVDSEDELQRALGIAFTDAGVYFRREVVLTPKDRIDFLLLDGAGVEVKTEGSISALTRQIYRYSQLPEIAALLVVTTRIRLANLPAMINGKRITTAVIARAFA